MRVFSAEVKQLIASGSAAICYLVDIITPIIAIRDTTCAYNLTFNGNIYSASNGLSIVEGPRLSSAVDRETYKITYIDPTFEKRALFEATLTGSKVITRVVFFNTTTGTLGGVAPGMPLLATEHVITAYAGVADTQGYAIAPDEGTVIAVIECSSPMASLEMSKSFITSRDVMRQLNPDDSSFDQVTVGSTKVAHVWGKA